MARFESGIAFATHDGVTLKGDLHSPETGHGHAVVIAAPGGAWLRGDRTDLAHWGQVLADAGIAMFSIDYRRSTNGKIFPQNARDVLAAVRFVDAEADVLGVDRRRMGLLGASAGAHLAALVAFAGNSPVLSGKESETPGLMLKIQAFVGVYGIYDLAAHWRACQVATTLPKDDMADRMMGAPLGESEPSYGEASPIAYVSTAGHIPEVLLVWGDSNSVVLPAQSEAFAAELAKAGAFPTTISVSGAGHFWFSKEKNTESGSNGEIASVVIRFLQDNLVRVTALPPAARR